MWWSYLYCMVLRTCRWYMCTPCECKCACVLVCGLYMHAVCMWMCSTRTSKMYIKFYSTNTSTVVPSCSETIVSNHSIHTHCVYESTHTQSPIVVCTKKSSIILNGCTHNAYCICSTCTSHSPRIHNVCICGADMRMYLQLCMKVYTYAQSPIVGLHKERSWYWMWTLVHPIVLLHSVYNNKSMGACAIVLSSWSSDDTVVRHI